MFRFTGLLGLFLCAFSLLRQVEGQAFNGTCPDYTVYSTEYHPPFSTGVYNLSFQRPPVPCRTFISPIVEDTITRINGTITDPDLARLFENSYPNTLDTAIKWHGYAANNSIEELTFIITGDINAMWLRDSANQMQSYLPLVTPSTSNNSLASLYRGVINLQSRYVNEYPHCNSFQPPAESGISPSVNGAGSDDTVTPPVVNTTVFECKYELDSLAAFLEISTNYYIATNDTQFFSQFQWIAAIQTILNTVSGEMISTYAADGSVNNLTYTFTRLTTTATETQSNVGRGNPIAPGTGLIRSFYRPSDDSAIYQLFIPANVMFAYYLNSTSKIMAQLPSPLASSLAAQMSTLSTTILAAVSKYGIVNDPLNPGTQIYTYETDGYGSLNLMDDANIPSLLSLPLFGVPESDSVYQATRSRILSPQGNPYFMTGPVINAVGGPHDSFGYGWPMASIVRILTSQNQAEITGVLKGILNSTDGLGLIHESINTFNVGDWTRQWFSWANGLFGQMIYNLDQTMPELLKESYQ